MEISINDYVRTKLGIAKLIEVNKYNSYVFDKLDEELWSGDIANEVYECYLTDIVIKSSPNIIDLIDEGDYIRIITSAYFEPIYYSYGKLVIRNDIDISKYSNKFIAEVITKEEIERRSYKVGE